MYRKILVPLDGSERSEQALRHAEAIIARAPRSSLILLRATEPLLPASYYLSGGMEWPEAQKKVGEDARDYLATIAARLKEKGIAQIETVVLEGQPDEQILNYLDKKKVDLVIMTTHGLSGLSRWLMGSVADRVLRHSTVPVLIVPPPGSRPRRRRAGASRASGGTS